MPPLGATATILRSFTQRKSRVNKMFGSWPSKLDGEMLPLSFRFWPK